MQTSLLKDILPSEHLKEYVRKHQVFRFVFDGSMPLPVKFHVPLPEHSITFYIRDPQKFSNVTSPDIYNYPDCVINGMYTVPIYRYGGNDFWAIRTVLQPFALFHLIRMPLQSMTNNFIDAEDVWGNKIRLVSEQLCSLSSLDKMIMIIEDFLNKIISNKNFSDHPIDKVANALLKSECGSSLDWLAGESCLSARQFIRKFEERAGLSAKTFQRIMRYDKAFRMKKSNPHLDWLSVAVRCDYHDYRHLAKDFQEFTHLTPPAYYELEKRSEKAFDSAET